MLEADLPQITDDLVIQGQNGATVDGAAGAYRGILAEEIDLLSIEGVDFRALAGTAIDASDVQELVVFSVGIEQVTGYGVNVYANGTRVEIADLDVRESRYDGMRMRLFNGAFADVRNVSVRDSGRVEATQPARDRGGVSVQAMHRATAELARIDYLESTDARDRGDVSRDFAGVVLSSSENARVTVSDATIIGPIDVALQLTGAGDSEISIAELSIEGVPLRTEHAVDIQASETAQVDVSDFRAVGSGSLLAELGDSSQVRLSRGLFDGSGTEAAMAAHGSDPAANGRFEAREVTIRNAPWTGLWVDGVADTDLTSITLAHNGTAEPGPALTLRGNDTVRVTNSTISDNDGQGVIVRSSDAPQQVLINSTTIADNTAEQFAVLRAQGAQTPSVKLRNSIVSGAAELEFEGPLDGFERDQSGVTSSYSLWNGVSADFADHIAASGSGNILNDDPQLGALADNGGFTLTRLPAADSLVIDAGDPDPTGTPATDQRGAARIDGIIDMGSVEAGTHDGGSGDGGSGDEGSGDGGAGDGGAGDEGSADGGSADGGSGESESGLGVTGPDASAEELAATGAARMTGLLLSGGIAAAAGLVLLLSTRLRRQST
ncbi:choice-of-anchor Q domain-containing protein [Microbacterium sp. MAHUQ-60]|uniref:choice-of-anchor Q domain-containing protein n=1 Tax=unclassified Microbacterium TaxID=2609290 RepID=UPI00360A8F3E